MPHCRVVIRAEQSRGVLSSVASVYDGPACLLVGVELVVVRRHRFDASSQRPGRHLSSHLIQRLPKLFLIEDDFYPLFYLLTLLQSSLICIF